MAKQEIIDPTLPTKELTIAGKTYRMCLDLNTLAMAEEALQKQGHKVDLLLVLPQLNSLGAMRTLFATAIHRFHPEIPFEQAVSIPGLAELYEVRAAIAPLWEESMPTPEKSTKADRP